MSGTETTPQTIVTLRIELVDTDPLVWREIEIPAAITLKQLHDVIQIAMDWDNAHLWEFAAEREQIGASRAARVRVTDLLRPRRTRLVYTYDFGDSWEHALTLTRPRPAEPDVKYPRYVAGENPAPPEDCGGIPGFYASLEVLADPAHPDHAEVKEWFGDYDPKVFDGGRVRDRIERMAARLAGAKRKGRSG